MRVECTKTKYASQSMADFDIKKISKKSNRATIPIRAYLCHCGSWHLTSRKDFNVEIKLLNDQILELKKENESIKKENESIKQQNEVLKSNKNKLQNHEIRVEERVQLVYKELSEMKRRFNNLRKDNSELIAKIIQLQK